MPKWLEKPSEYKDFSSYFIENRNYPPHFLFITISIILRLFGFALSVKMLFSLCGEEKMRRLFSENRSWGWTMAYAACQILVGGAALCFPFTMSIASGLFFGWLLVVAAIFAIISGFSSRHIRGHWLDIICGVIAFVTGVIAIEYPVASALTIVWLIACWLLLVGLTQLFIASRIATERNWLLLRGAVNTLIALFLFFSSDKTSLAFLGLAVGFAFVSEGIGMAMLALRLKRLQEENTIL
ncbi:uncharacterized membrane protein HdeD (DUF308 family) [Zymomonas mobilis]|uniref:Uncharacterized membrane protein HdeD (DUF308 family) n=2 Tax=Zymomonas mobilis TaxID=542 RepID=A0A542W2P9_ZYMMB|nr:uncharacterized membrane protein HdeD (DUF308 family) [Zymomonas mobilis]